MEIQQNSTAHSVQVAFNSITTQAASSAPSGLKPLASSASQPPSFLPGSPLSDKPSTGLQGIVDRLKQASDTYLGIGKIAAEQRSADRANGIGILDGLASLDNRMHSAQVALNAAQSFAPGLPLGQQLEAIGATAQQIQLADYQDRLIHYALEKLGYEQSTASGNGLVELAAQVFGIQRQGSAPGVPVVVGANRIPSTGAGAPVGGVSNSVALAGALYSAYQMVDSWGQSNPAAGAIQGASIGGYIGSVIPGIGTAAGAALGGIVGAFAGSIKSGKHKDQKARDAMRSFLEDRGMIDNKHQLTLADGSKYEIGIDGRNRYENIDGTLRAPYQNDFSNPLTAQAIGWANPLASVLMGGDQKLSTDLTGYLVNAATSNATDIETVRSNILNFFVESGLTLETIVGGLGALRQNNALSQADFEAYIHGLETLISGTVTESAMQEVAVRKVV